MEKKLPSAYRRFASEHPRIIAAYEALGDATLGDGPLDRKTAELVKLGIAVRARLEGAARDVRRARRRARRPTRSGTIRLATTTIGFPSMMSALSWANDLLAPDAKE
jgi:alkylhydroperoxidase/carboxymuconolactone decarboxylase family protein YurZ